MNRRSPSLTGRLLLRRVGGTVAAASAGALVTALVLAVSSGPSTRQQEAGPPERTERPSRALARDTGATTALTERLLPGPALPATADGATWSVAGTEPHEPRSLAGTCHRYPLVSVGALGVAHRAYVVPGLDGVTAEHVVARFADERTAWRAREVLLAWQAGCGDVLADRSGLRISAPRRSGDAVRYAVTWVPPGAGARVREDVALVHVGSRVALVRVTTAPADPDTALATVAPMAARAEQLLRDPGAVRTR